MPLDLSLITAPMVNQSDLPFRTLTMRYGATTAYTQMLFTEKLLNDQEYFEFHRKDLEARDPEFGTVVQLCGNDPQTVVNAGRKLQDVCDGIDLNLGCPQEAARDGHFGAYLLGQKDWPLVESIVSSMSQSFTTIPVSTKLRLCQPSTKTLDLAERLEACGSSWVTLHARTVSARRRRQGAADLSEVKILKESERITVPVISNGNVRVFEDLSRNLKYTGADGLMVGETILGNPCIFSNIIPDPVDISLEYLDICHQYPGVATLHTVQTHIRHFVEYQCSRRPWYNKFRSALNNCSNLDDLEHLLRFNVQRWRGKAVKASSEIDSDDEAEAVTDVDLSENIDLLHL